MYKAIIILLFCTSNIFGQKEIKLHLVSFADTIDVNIGKGCRNDLVFIKDFFVNNVGEILDIEVIDHNVNNIFSTEKLVSLSKNIEISTNDVVVFFYSGHGYRYIDQNNQEKPYPYLLFDPNEKDRLNFNLAGVHEAFMRAKPRLTITIGDLCNSVVEFMGAEDDNSSYLSSINKEVLEKLFLDSKGDVLVSSSSPGEASWIIPDSDQPISVFTASFLWSIEEFLVMETDDTSWENIIFQTKRYALELCDDLRKTPQNVMYNINVTYK